MAFERLIGSLKVYGAVLGVALLMSGVSFASRALQTDQQQTGVLASASASPAQTAPGGEVTFTLEGFTPNSRLLIGRGDASMRLTMFTGKDWTDADGQYTRTVRIPDFSELGTILIPFRDERGIEAAASVMIAGRSPRPLIVGSEFERQGEVLLYRFHGLGWNKGRKKTLTLADIRTGQTVTLTADDLCDVTPCSRDDKAELVVQIPSTVIPGDHPVEISEEGTNLKSSFVLSTAPSEATDPAQKPRIDLVSPPMATPNVPSILLRGTNWGPYEHRMTVRAWLFNPEKPNIRYELTVDRNYRDDELFVRLELTDEIRALPGRDYVIYVLTESGHEALAPFYLLQKPDFSGVKKPTIVLTPAKGRVGTYVVVTGAGFPAKAAGIVRLSGMQLPGTAIADEDGAFDNVGFVIPRTLEKNGKVVSLMPGKHSFEVDAGGGAFARVSFEIEASDDDKGKRTIEEEEKKRRLELEKDKKGKERTEQELALHQKKEQKLKDEQDRLETTRKELEKKQKRSRKESEQLKKVLTDDHAREKKLSDLEKKIRTLEGERDTLERDILAGTYAGKPCRAEMAITLQPGCMPPIAPHTPAQPFAGKPCDVAVPRVWQEGCVPAAEGTVSGERYVPNSAGKPCRNDMAITFQPGCTPPLVPEPIKPYKGKPCDPLLPRVWQEGCIRQ